MVFRSRPAARRLLHPYSLSILFISFGGSPVRAAADQPPVILISASRVAQPAEQVGSTVVVLLADELQQRGVEFVADALAEVPSLALASAGPRGSQTQVRVRGNEANHVLVLIDGMRVSQATTGEYDLANLSLAGIDKIEVLLGPQSTLYGGDAIAGVISITTTTGQGAPGGKLRLDLGSLGTRAGSIQAAGAVDGWHYALTADRFQTDGISAASEKNGNLERDGYTTQGVKFKAGYDQEHLRTWVVYHADRSRYEFDGEDFVTGLAVDAAANRQWVDTRALSWVLAVPLADERMQNQLQLSAINNDYESYSELFGSGSSYQSQTRRDAVAYNGSFKPSEHQHFQFGAEQVKERLETEGFGLFRRSATQQGAYLNWLSTWGPLDLSLGGRHDQHESFGGHNTYRLTANWRLGEGLRIRASHGTGFKAPSLQELYDQEFGGNPDLQPEESTGSELGAEVSWGGYDLSLTLFDQDVTHLIRYLGAYPNGQNENVGRANSQGVELGLSRSWQNLKLDAALSRTDATETDDGITSRRLRVPTWAGNLKASYRLGPARLWAQAQYRGERQDKNFATGDRVDLDSYWLLHGGVSYDLSDGVTLTGRIENLTDTDYEEIHSYGTRGRTGLVYLDWRF